MENEIVIGVLFIFSAVLSLFFLFMLNKKVNYIALFIEDHGMNYAMIEKTIDNKALFYFGLLKCNPYWIHNYPEMRNVFLSFRVMFLSSALSFSVFMLSLFAYAYGT